MLMKNDIDNWCNTCYNPDKTYDVVTLGDGNQYKTCVICDTETLVTEDDNLVEIPE